MNFNEAYELIDIKERLDVLWKERELITAVLYQDYCKRNNLPIPKHIDTLLQTAYNNMMSMEQEQIQEVKEEPKTNIKVKDFR